MTIGDLRKVEKELGSVVLSRRGTLLYGFGVLLKAIDEAIAQEQGFSLDDLREKIEQLPDSTELSLLAEARVQALKKELESLKARRNSVV